MGTRFHLPSTAFQNCHWRTDGGQMEEMEKSAPLLPISRVDRLGGD